MRGSGGVWLVDVLRVVGVRFWNRIGGTEGFCFVDRAHVLSESVGAGEGSVAFYRRRLGVSAAIADGVR